MMTEGEKMVWAAAYAADYTRQLNDRSRLGTRISIPASIDNAWYAVEQMRKARPAIVEGFGNSPVLSMLDEMLTPYAKLEEE